ncbi:MAG TPA: VWA domain-containing protein [Longimicrobium sp.]|nr:VWA domain-containing protein [Longimicrobium sp.]
MLTFGSPAFLLAGALAALVPLALHLIRRRPPSRAPLPTARFLSPDPRTSVRVGRPTDLLLLALRMLLLVLAAAAFARPVWRPAARGSATVVLLDRGAAMAGGDAWPHAVAAARQRLLALRGDALGSLVLFDSAATVIPPSRVTPALFDSLAAARPTAGSSRFAAALRAIPAAVGGLREADSLRVALVTRPRWHGWSDGLGPLRHAVWPGAIELVELPDLDAGDGEIVAENVKAKEAIYFADALDRLSYAKPALEATGWRVRLAIPSADAVLDSARLMVVRRAVPAGVAAALTRAATAGATVVVTAPAAASLRGFIPWAGAMRVDSGGGGMWLASGPHVSGTAMRVSGDAARGAAVIASWDDGRPAAAARRLGRGCVVFAATDLDRGEMTLDAEYPRLLDGLAHGCEPSDGPSSIDRDTPLDAGARAVLRGTGPRVVAARTVPGWGGGVPLGRWAMAAALLAALAETFFAYGRRRAV